jgi:hypothetical protein
MEHLKMADGKSHSEGNDPRGQSKDPELGSSDIIVSHTEIPEKMEEKKMMKRNWIKSITIPTALVVFVLGVVLAFIRQPSIGKQLRVGPSTPHVVHISRRDWRIAFVRAAIPQIPLSVLNSVFAVCKLSQDLFPSQDAVSSFNVSVCACLSP